nr:8-amino-7-oxononanoate synthase [Candidatus Acidoferrales bacterium]
MLDEEANALTRSLEKELREIESRGQLRTLEIPAGINFCSNDYLGLSTNPALRVAVMDAVEHAERVGSTGSRLLAGNAREWEELESEFAQFAGTDAALYFTSGYAANVGLLSAVAGRGDIIFSDAANHASLIDGARISGAEKVVFPHCDLAALELALHDRASQPGRKLVVTESVFSMDGDLAPLREMALLAKRYGAEMVVDEAHATGVFGVEGRGRVAELGLVDETFAVVHMCGKALASAGAFVCGGATLKNYLINRARTFLFNTALPPYFARQIGAALALARRADAERAQLRAMSTRLRQDLRESGWDTGKSASQIVPVLLGENDVAMRIAAELAREGFAVRAIRPPTVAEGTARLRLSLNCGLKDEKLAGFVRAMAGAREMVGAVGGERTK